MRVDFEFKIGDFVRTDTGKHGVIVVASAERGGHFYLVDTGDSRWPYAGERLEATDARPHDEAGR